MDHLSYSDEPAPSRLRTLAGALSSLILVISIGGALLSLFIFSRYGVIPIGMLLVGAYFGRELLLTFATPPRYWYLGRGIVRYGLRLIVVLFRWSVRSAVAGAFGLLMFFALVGVGSSSEAALFATFVGTFIAMTVLQQVEWGRVLIQRGQQLEPPGGDQGSSRGDGGVLVIIREHTREIYHDHRYVERIRDE